jgi:hypothetical protein
LRTIKKRSFRSEKKNFKAPEKFAALRSDGDLQFLHYVESQSSQIRICFTNPCGFENVADEKNVKRKQMRMRGRGEQRCWVRRAGRWADTPGAYSSRS